MWTCGATDNASAYGAEDSRFESWQVRNFFIYLHDSSYHIVVNFTMFHGDVAQMVERSLSM